MHKTIAVGSTNLVSCPDPPRKSERGSGVLNDVSCLMEGGGGGGGGGLNGIKNAFHHALHPACKMIPSCAVCTIALPVSNSVAPSIQHLHLTTGLWTTLLLFSPEL